VGARLICPCVLEQTLLHAPYGSWVRGRCATNGGEVVAQRLEEVAAARAAGPPAESSPSTPRGGAAGADGAARRPGQPARAALVAAWCGPVGT